MTTPRKITPPEKAPREDHPSDEEHTGECLDRILKFVKNSPIYPEFGYEGFVAHAKAWDKKGCPEVYIQP